LDSDYLPSEPLPAADEAMRHAWQIVVQSPDTGAIVALSLAVLLLIVSGLISASEVSYFSLSPEDRQRLADEEDPADSIISKLLQHSERLMASILIGNNFVNVAIIMLLTFVMNHIFVSISPAMNFLIQTVVLTFLLLLFGEIMPKVYATHHPLRFARRTSHMMQGMQTLFHPFISILVHSTSSINRHFAARVNDNVTVDDLSDALKLTKQVVKEEKKMLEEIIKFGDKTVKDAMTSRMDMTTVDVKSSFSDVIKLVVETNYSRIPVYEETEDHIKGILYIKDLLPYLNQSDTFKWQDLIRSPYFVPENKMIDDLLDDFRRKRMHMAIVVDEFGGTSGLITMEDVLEEIVGEIRDEYDDEETSWQKVGRNEWIFEARTALNDFYKVTGLEAEQFEGKTENCESLGGLILELKQSFPRVHEIVRYQNCEFTILAMERRRIDRIRVKILAAS
jgi:gliding motility-associated protein GldE